jgi:hypothetical protein
VGARRRVVRATGRAGAAILRRIAVRLVVLALTAVGAAAIAVSATREAGTVPKPIVYPRHTGIVATVFWIGEPVGNGSTENNAISAWDDKWLAHYGGKDPYRPYRKAPYFPSFVPKENPFYLDLPYDDFDNNGDPRPNRASVVPWAGAYAPELANARRTGAPFSLLKNRWVKLWRVVGGKTLTCYGQIEDSGPYVYDDWAYVFGSHDARPASKEANNAGMDVSPAIRDCLRFSGLNNDTNRLDWQFVVRAQVPPGPWTRVVTTRQVYWP